MAASQTVSVGRLVAGMAVFVGLGIPLVAYCWETMNQVLAGRFHGRRMILTLLAAALLVALFGFLARALRRWERGIN